MNVLLWVVQAILAAMFAASGLLKAIQPMDKLAGRYPWVRDFSQPTVRFIGVMEVLGAIGLVAPAASGIAPVLTPVAGAGLAAMMVLAAALHTRRKELRGVVITAVLFVPAVLVALARFGPYGS